MQNGPDVGFFSTQNGPNFGPSGSKMTPAEPKFILLPGGTRVSPVKGRKNAAASANVGQAWGRKPEFFHSESRFSKEATKASKK